MGKYVEVRTMEISSFAHNFSDKTNMRISTHELKTMMPLIREDSFKGYDCLATIYFCLKQYNDSIDGAKPGITSSKSLEAARDNFVCKLESADVDLLDCLFDGLGTNERTEACHTMKTMYVQKVVDLLNLWFDLRPGSRYELINHEEQLRKLYLPVFNRYARYSEKFADAYALFLHGFLDNCDVLYKEDERDQLGTILSDLGNIYSRWTDSDTARCMYLGFLRDKAFGENLEFVTKISIPHLQWTWKMLSKRACQLKYHATRVRIQNHIEDARLAVENKGLKAKATAIFLVFQGLKEEERIDREVVPMMELLLQNRAGEVYNRDSRNGIRIGNGCHVAIEIIRPAIGAALLDIAKAVEDKE